MQNSIHSILHTGSDGYIIDVECNMTQSLPATIIVGLGNKSIDEAKERLRSAFSHSNMCFPTKRIVINLAPADIPKDSTAFDMAMAVAILQADKKLQKQPLQTDCFIGELGLDGRIRPVRGIIGKLVSGRKLGLTRFYVPEANLPQAKLIPDISVVSVSTLSDLLSYINETAEYEIYHSSGTSIKPVNTRSGLFDLVVGQAQAKRALEIAAAGGHNIFLSGPPGTGKSMLAKALPELLPPMSPEEVLETTHIHSLASLHFEELVTERPFRSPHHSASQTSIVGGGQPIKPGEISLSHNGVLFLDEMPEFKHATLEALRQPLEDRTITITRAQQSVRFPASFMLVATANPCPCGYYGVDDRCICTASQILRYRQRVSGPILDRIDLHVVVDTVNHASLLHTDTPVDLHAACQERIKNARQKQQNRFGSRAILNATMDNTSLTSLGSLNPDAETLLITAAKRLQLSARSYMRTIKVARTIADLEDSTSVLKSHVSEALQYRPQINSSIP